MRSRVLPILAVLSAAGCIDFKEGLVCSADTDCLGYLCVNAACKAPESGNGSGGGGAGGTGGAAGSGGQTTTIASGQKNAVSLRLDGVTLYWLAEDAGRLKLRKAVKTGTGSVEIADLGSSSVSKKPALVVGTDSLFVVIGKQVLKVTKTGGTPSVLATSTGADYGGGIGIAGSTLVWLSPGSGGSVWKMPVAGGTVVQLASNEYVETLIASGSTIYWATTSAVVVYDLAAGTRSQFAGGPGQYPKGLALAGSVVTWLEGEGGFPTIVSTQVGSGTSSKVTVNRDLIAAAADGAKTLYGVSRSKEDLSSTGLFTVNADDGKFTYVRATGGSGTTGGLASEVLADANNVFLVVDDLILRRAR